VRALLPLRAAAGLAASLGAALALAAAADAAAAAPDAGARPGAFCTRPGCTGERPAASSLAGFALATLASVAGKVVLVSNEVGSGIMPDNALARRFADALGTLNQRVASLADEVILVAAGLPLFLRRSP